MLSNTIVNHFFWIFLALPVVSFGETQDTHFNTKTPIFGITAVDDEDSKVVEPESAPGGAAEMIRYFSTQLHLELTSCGQAIGSIFDSWLRVHKMIPEQKETKPDKYFMRAWEVNRKGIFEAKYIVSAEPKYVRVSLDFYDISGEHLSLQSINQLNMQYEISKYWKLLEEALECGT